MVATCPCVACGVNIEFDAVQIGETVACPSCQQATLLFQVKAVRPRKVGIIILLALASCALVAILYSFRNVGKDAAELFGQGFLGIGMLVAGLLIYFLPSLLARKKRNAVAIFALNLLLGWTFVGWVAALVWALVREKE